MKTAVVTMVACASWYPSTRCSAASSRWPAGVAAVPPRRFVGMGRLSVVVRVGDARRAARADTRAISARGRPGMASTKLGDTAIVLGAGIGGLTSAAALSPRFERVIVLERDVLPATAESRDGTPQARHVHALLAGGERALNELLPGFT